MQFLDCRTITFFSSGLCLDSFIGQFTPALALYDPYGVDVPLNVDIIMNECLLKTWKSIFIGQRPALHNDQPVAKDLTFFSKCQRLPKVSAQNQSFTKVRGIFGHNHL